MVVSLGGRLDVSASALWRRAIALVEETLPPRLVVDGSAIESCDVAGVGLLVDLKIRQESGGRVFELINFPERYRHLFELFPSDLVREKGKRVLSRGSVSEELGRSLFSRLRDLRLLIAFIGELTSALAFALAHPRRARWGRCREVMVSAGVDAFPIIGLMGFLIGLILAFQAGVPMRQYGADIFIINLVSITMLRELGPLITAVIFTGRSGSAFAAEIGTMKVNDEVSALATMGIDPVKFLAVPKVLAAILVMPLLTIFANLFGLIGATLVVMGMGYPLIVCLNRVVESVSVGDLLGGLFKSLVFGLLIAGVGCLKGLRTSGGAQSVGISTTRAVVAGIILIIVSDGVFAVLFYYLGI